MFNFFLIGAACLTLFYLQCFGWAWYLANDMQFYIIAPAILFTAYRYSGELTQTISII